MSKVKGHASWADVRRGLVRRQDKVGNAWADKLAVEGSEKHVCPAGLADANRERKELAIQYQGALVKIIMAYDKAVAQQEEVWSLS